MISRRQPSEKRALLLGGSGYLGSAVHAYLKGSAWTADTLDLEWFGSPAGVQSSVRDYATLTRAELAEYSAVILFAAHASVLMCARDREAAFTNNVANFVELLGKLDGQRFVYASSARVYGAEPGVEASEVEDRFQAATYYDLMKCEIDHYARLSDVDYYGLRLGTASGFAPHLRTDVMLNKMYASWRETGTIHVVNPEVSRPILGVQDLCRAVEVVLDTESPRPGLYNLASFNSTVGEIAESAAHLLGAEIMTAPPALAHDMRMSTRKFQETFGFQFRDTPQAILTSLEGGWETALKTTREEAPAYVQAR